MQALSDTLLRSDGHTEVALRQQVTEFVTAIMNGHEAGDTIPESLQAYLRKLAKHAYRITDEDVAALRSDGYSEDMIFELTTTGALAAALAQMDRGLAALAASETFQTPSTGDS